MVSESNSPALAFTHSQDLGSSEGQITEGQTQTELSFQESSTLAESHVEPHAGSDDSGSHDSGSHVEPPAASPHVESDEAPEEKALTETVSEMPEESAEESSSENSNRSSTTKSFSEFDKMLQTLPNAEEKLQAIFTYMQAALEERAGPLFKEFWDSRKLSLPLFKELPSGLSRNQLWARYIELTREGRRLKSLLDEETAFAVEQIDIAITALEADVQQIEALSSDDSTSITALSKAKTLQKNGDRYTKIQLQLNLLNVLATRIQAMRKELIKQQMRIKQKNQFFERLSLLGDKVFPIRKALIKEQSDLFIADVKSFVSTHFSENFSQEGAKRNLFFLRSEIKELQASAKVLTLNTHAFSTAREQLSQCWDALKGAEKEFKKEASEYRAQSQENAQKIREKLTVLMETQANATSPEEASEEIARLQQQMRAVSLTRDDVVALKEEMQTFISQIEAKQNLEAEQRKQKQKEQEKIRQGQINDFIKGLETLKTEIESIDLPQLRERWTSYQRDLSALCPTKSEKQMMDRLLKGTLDLINRKEETSLLSISDSDREAVEKLRVLLEERKVHRKEIKAHLNDLRKAIGGSGFNIEKAMQLNEQRSQEEEQLEQLDETILEIEKKLRQFKLNNQTSNN